MTATTLRKREQRAAAKSAEPEERLREYLRTRNLRMTPERRWVLQGVLSREGHFDAEELLAFLHRRQMPVSRATLYRTLEHLTASGLVKMHRFGRGHALYEHIYGRQHHDHMVCDRCGKVIEFVNDQIERLQDQVCRDHDFVANNHVMQIFGVCASCQKRDEGQGAEMVRHHPADS
jgi:Fur family transcriptional regulator, ferric uptake regulator